ncbi:MAG: DUF3164 family protein [Chlorobium sp.]|nr:DUF3164 family protein [Chlorobium sp.]
MKQIDLDTLTPAQLDELRSQLAEKEKADKERIRKERESYKGIVTQTVKEQFLKLQNLSSELSLVKADIFGQFASIIELKNELYGTKSGQQSHTFTDDDGRSISIGYRQIESFDDTLDMGIAKVREYIDSLAVDENSARIVDLVNKLLKKDAKGNLKASRVLDLQNFADKVQNPLLIEGVNIIREAYKPTRSSIFIEAESRDVAGTGAAMPVPLSITSVDFPEGTNIRMEVFK